MFFKRVKLMFIVSFTDALTVLMICVLTDLVEWTKCFVSIIGLMSLTIAWLVRRNSNDFYVIKLCYVETDWYWDW